MLSDALDKEWEDHQALLDEEWKEQKEQMNALTQGLDEERKEQTKELDKATEEGQTDRALLWNYMGDTAEWVVDLQRWATTQYVTCVQVQSSNLTY